MPVFAPGVAAGFNDFAAIDRQKQKDQLAAQEQTLRMKRQQFDMEEARQQQARDLEARRGFGAGLYRMYPPGAGGAPGGPQPPPPGQSSAPAGGPPQGGMQPQGGPPGAGGPPQGGQPPGPPQPMPPQGGQPPGPPQPPGMMPVGARPPQGGPPPQDPALMRAMGDVAALQRELARPGQNSEQRQILTDELGKAQERLAQLRGQQTPYRTIPTGGQGAQGGPPQQPPQVGMQAPPVAPTQPQQPSLLRRFVMAAQQNGVPPEDLADQIKLLNPIMQNEMREELLQLRGTQAMSNEYIRMADLEIKRLREGRQEGVVPDRKEDRRDREGEVKQRQAQERIEIARKKATEGGAPTASELANEDTARVFYDIFKTTGAKPPFAWGKGGESDRAQWMKWVAKFSKEDGGGKGIAADQAEGKARTSALAANEKRNVGLDVGARETLADMKTLDSILDRVATKGGAKIINRPINKLRDLGSDPEYGQLELATKQVATKYERMLSGGILSVAQLHEGAREDAKKILSGDMTVGEIRAKLPLMTREMENAQTSGKATSKSVKDSIAGKGGGDADAIAWAKAHPQDPRAAKILALHPGQ